jgi:hypothetical protein
MALPKLPCEYPELEKQRWKHCFGDLPETKQKELKQIIEKINKII